MKRNRYYLIICLLTLTAVKGQNNEPEKILNSAIYQEEVKGDLSKAIDLYEKIVKKYSKNRAVTATALYHLGFANEKLGIKSAQGFYEQVIRNYVDQPKQVEMARSRLNQILAFNKSVVQTNLENAKIGNPVIARKIFSDPGMTGDISPDGKYISDVDWNTGNMIVHNLETGKNKLITNEGSWDTPNKFGDNSVWSPDGKFLAYFWIIGKSAQLRIQNFATGEDRILVQSPIKEKCPWPMEWSRDGKYLLTTAALDESQTNKALQLVSVKDGSVKIIKMLEDQCACGGASISPDGKYVVASIGKEEKNRDIRIFSVDGTYDKDLISLKGSDWAPRWTPDGNKVIYASNGSGPAALWTIKVKDGKKVGEPELVYDGISDKYFSMRFTDSGNFIFASTSMYANIFQANINPDEGIIETPTPITGTKPGLYSTPFWSPDGNKIAYAVTELQNLNNNNIVIHNLKTGKIKELKLDLLLIERPPDLAWPQWSNDSESILLHYFPNPKVKHKELVIVNTETEDKKYLKGGSWKIFGPENTILYVDSGGKKILQENIKTSNKKILYEADKKINHLTISQDKTTLAFLVEGQNKLYSMPINSSEPTLLWETTNEQFFHWRGGLHFFPDGKTILLLLATLDKENSKIIKSRQYYTINSSTLEKKHLGKKIVDPENIFFQVSLSPDGKKIAFCKTKKSSNLWSLEFDY